MSDVTAATGLPGIWLFVGLGNPGPEYRLHRHNVGYQCLNVFARRHGLDFSKSRGQSRVAEGTIGEHRVILARPQTFMNDSGRAVGKLLDRYSLEPEDLIVVYDDVDLPLGKIRVRAKGGPGTHNGMRSIVREIGEGFPRVRCGVAPADAGAEMPRDLADHVLTPFEADERDAAEAMVVRAAEAVEVAIRDGLEAAMSRWNAEKAE